VLADFRRFLKKTRSVFIRKRLTRTVRLPFRIDAEHDVLILTQLADEEIKRIHACRFGAVVVQIVADLPVGLVPAALDEAKLAAEGVWFVVVVPGPKLVWHPRPFEGFGPIELPPFINEVKRPQRDRIDAFECAMVEFEMRRAREMFIEKCSTSSAACDRLFLASVGLFRSGVGSSD